MKHLQIKIDFIKYNDELVFRDYHKIINPNDRFALVWWNWAWKSTFLRIITWQEKNFNGSIENIWSMRLWYLEQIYDDDQNKLVYEEIKEAFSEIIKYEIKLKELELLMNENPEDIEIIERYTKTLEIFNNIWWYEYNAKIHQVAKWLWILWLLDKKIVDVSGGERTKVALARLLLFKPDFLVLDEPTNFLDIAWIEWLEDYLSKRWKWWYCIVSHDREFINNICPNILEITPEKTFEYYWLPYKEYIVARAKNIKKKIEKFNREQEYIKKEEWLIRRFKAWSRAWFAKSRAKALAKRDILIRPELLIPPKFVFQAEAKSPKKLLELKEIFIWREDPLFFIQELKLYKKQKTVIIWENWSWKSTLLKTILKKIRPLDWIIQYWKDITIANYSQLHEELILDETVLENCKKKWLPSEPQILLAILAQIWFTKDFLHKKIRNLSWWERSKLLFTIIWYYESNLLILDEPTNHLDYESREALEQALSKYEWTILCVAHDRYFINKIASYLWIIEWDEITEFYWNYAEYIERKERWIDFIDKSMLSLQSESDLVNLEKLWEKTFKRMQRKFWKSKNLKK